MTDSADADTELDVMITIRILMSGKEIGAIIGKGGSVIASFRQKSGAKINIPTAQGTPERIVTVTGYRCQVVKAFKLITEKLEQDINASVSTSVSTKVPVSLKLIVPASQCGSIIGRGGSKIKEIRDTSACSIQVQSDMLPFSTERSVMLNGSPCAIVHCVDMLCDVMIQFPAKFATVPYQPQSANPPVIFHHGQAYTIKGNYAVPHPEITQLRQLAEMHSYTEDSIGGLFRNFTQLSGDNEKNFDGSTSACVNLPTKIVDAETQETTVSNEIVGCIIGKHGSRIKEIRAISGARISIDESTEKNSKKERTITITGNPEEISLAQYLINTSIQLFSHQSKQSKQPPAEEEPSTSTPQPLMSLTPSPSNRPILIDKLLGGVSAFAYGRPGLAGPYPGASAMQPGTSFSLAMESARLALLNGSRHYSNLHSNRTRHSRRASHKKEAKSACSDCDEEGSPSPDDSSPNGKEKRKAKREKFQPY